MSDALDTAAKAAMATAMLVACILFACLIGATVGAFSGWIVGGVWGAPILNALDALGVRGIAVWELGCLLGFVCGFIPRGKTTVSR
jgi:hypothetical protein